MSISKRDKQDVGGRPISFCGSAHKSALGRPPAPKEGRPAATSRHPYFRGGSTPVTKLHVSVRYCLPTLRLARIQGLSSKRSSIKERKCFLLFPARWPLSRAAERPLNSSQMQAIWVSDIWLFKKLPHNWVKIVSLGPQK